MISYCIVDANDAGIHSTLKLNLRKMLLPLDRVLPFFCESLIRRKLNVDRKHSATSVKTLLESTRCLGFSNFTKHLTASLTDEGIKLTLDQFQRGFGYKVEKLLNSSDIERALRISQEKRGPSAARFRCLVKVEYSTDNNCTYAVGEYYQVKSRTINGSVDLVFISPTGGIACTSSSYARWGIPSKHIFALFYDGSISINMKQHFHPVYHLQFIDDIAVDSVALHTVSSDIPNGNRQSIGPLVSWNWAQVASASAWELVGLGGEEYRAAAHPSAKSVSEAPESKAEKTKKALHYIAPFINSSIEESQIFYLYYEGLLSR